MNLGELKDKDYRPLFLTLSFLFTPFLLYVIEIIDGYYLSSHVH